jgi:hypothetical protein
LARSEHQYISDALEAEFARQKTVESEVMGVEKSVAASTNQTLWQPAAVKKGLGMIANANAPFPVDAVERLGALRGELGESIVAARGLGRRLRAARAKVEAKEQELEHACCKWEKLQPKGDRKEA